MANENIASRSDAPPRWMSPSQLANYLGVSLRQVGILEKEGRIKPSRHLGPRLPRFDRLQIDRILAGEQQPPEAVRLAM
jgi:hypothetical protein